MKQIIITQAIMEMVVVMLMTTRRIRMTLERETMAMEMITIPMMATTRIKKEIKIIRKEGTKIKINKVVERARRVSRTKINLRKIHQKIWRQVSSNFDTVMIAIREIL